MVLVKGVLGPGDGPVGVNPKNITNMPQPSSGRELPNYQNSDSRAIYSKTDLRIYIYIWVPIYIPLTTPCMAHLPTFGWFQWS